MRVETDSIGEVKVDDDRYWGAQTQRSLKYFSIGNDKMPLEVVRAMAIIKKASAISNHELGILTEQKKDLIIRASKEVLDENLNDNFPLYVWMTGSGTQLNMNVNEVIANRANELYGNKKGTKSPIHPNDDVNKSQSSNDSFPTAMNISAVIAVSQKLLPAVKYMKNHLQEKAQAWMDITKLGRTHMQDAVPMKLGEEFSGYVAQLEKNIKRIKLALQDVYELALGGTAIGTGINAPHGFAELVAKNIAQITKLPFITAANKFEVQGSHDALVALMSALKVLANSLFKITNDIRILSCGPRAGLFELILPENEPGSSIMPGKVNPTQCEAMAMVATQVMGLDAAVSIAGSAGYLEMNVYKPLIIFNIIQSVQMMSDSMYNFSDYLIKGMLPNKKKIDYYLHNSLMLVTALTPSIGYDRASKLAHYAYQKDISLREANLQLELLPQEKFDELINDSIK
ncbi:fumarate hydratase class II [Francisella halioticida]|uniref:Fumarate hydratase class II n=1 Tax=Francisella halioticida TaxID=549298 RepID=A0ABM6LXD7_9GAMM|nr:class II fumarate hydratase [Francisella halioticida]ASG67125.1 fumarate hydratase, class II [Francisella halioticida]BCD91929.1 fumarate hydratase class II [Francisella halioticida]